MQEDIPKRKTTPMMRFIFSLTFLSTIGLPVSAQDMPLSQILIEGEGWELVSAGYKFTEGPAANEKGEVFFTDVSESKIYKIDLDGNVTLWAEETNATAGLMFGADGVLYGTSIGGGAIVKFSADGKMVPVADGISCNDLVIDGNGNIYFTDHTNGNVMHIPVGGKPKVVAQEITFPNGLILWNDQQSLVVSDMRGANLWNFRVETDGSLSFKQPYSTMELPVGSTESGADGMTTDKDGRIYVCTTKGIQVFDTTGRYCGVVSKPQRAFLSNIAFGGTELDTIYVTCADKVYKRKLNTKGIRYAVKVQTP